MDSSHRLRLRAGRSASTLSGIVISCSCGERRSMAGAFNRDSLEHLKPCVGIDHGSEKLMTGKAPVVSNSR
jgi:hypothetical protein